MGYRGSNSHRTIYLVPGCCQRLAACGPMVITAFGISVWLGNMVFFVVVVLLDVFVVLVEAGCVHGML